MSIKDVIRKHEKSELFETFDLQCLYQIYQTRILMKVSHTVTLPCHSLTHQKGIFWLLLQNDLEFCLVVVKSSSNFTAQSSFVIALLHPGFPLLTPCSRVREIINLSQKHWKVLVPIFNNLHFPSYFSYNVHMLCISMIKLIKHCANQTKRSNQCSMQFKAVPVTNPSEPMNVPNNPRAHFWSSARAYVRENKTESTCY